MASGLWPQAEFSLELACVSPVSSFCDNDGTPRSEVGLKSSSNESHMDLSIYHELLGLYTVDGIRSL